MSQVRIRLWCAILAASGIAGISRSAHAVSDEVRTACGRDYSAYCAMHPVGSAGVRACMRENRKRLAPRCRHALATSREATAADIRRYEIETGRKVR